MKELINNIKNNTHLTIKGEECTVKTKTWYSIEEDMSVSYVKCELSNNKVLVIIPDDELMYVGAVIKDMKYKRLSNDELEFEKMMEERMRDNFTAASRAESSITAP